MTPIATEPSDLVGCVVSYQGKQVRVVGHEVEPKRTDANPSSKPIYWIVEVGPREYPWDFWQAVLVSEVEAQRVGNGAES